MTDYCKACEYPITKKNTEYHHWPIPKRNGGTVKVPLCLTCHDMVDRLGWKSWPLDIFFKGWGELSREGRLLMMKIASQAHYEGLIVDKT